MDFEDRDTNSNDQKTIEFLRLLSRHENRVKSYLLALVPNWSDADDLFQETSVRLWEQFADYDSTKDFGAWACTIAYYMVIAYRKKSGREKQRLSQAFVDAVSEQAIATSEETELRHYALQGCLQKLSERNRQLVRRCYSCTDTLKEIAEQMNRSIASLYKALSRIRHALHDCVEKKIQEERVT